MFQLVQKIPLACLLLAALPAHSQNTITTVAGDGAAMYFGDGGPAGSAALNHPRGLAIAPNGTLYIADVDNFRVRGVSSSGIIYTVAGTGVSGATGDGGMAVLASFSDVMGLALDPAGNLYIADGGNRRIRKVTPAGIVTTVAGTGVQGSSGDGGAAIGATLNRPTSIIVDSAGSVYFSDSSNQRIRRIGTDGTITTVAGNGLDGFSGDGGLATVAAMSFPLGLAKDQAGNLYFTDANNNRVRRVTPAGVISTIAGNGRGMFAGDGGFAVGASLNLPSDLAFDLSGNMYIADAGNNRIRKVDSAGIITTVAGTGADGFSGDGGPAAQAMLSYPWGLATDAAGRVFIADRVNSRIRQMSAPVLGAPLFQDGAAVNGASFVKNFAIAPGSFVTIFGSNLADGATSASGAPYPTILGSTTVAFNGIPAPLFFVSPGQINAQAPFDLGTGTVSMKVTHGGLSASGAVSVANVSPGIFIMDQNTSQGAILRADYSLVSSGNPARVGETLAIYCTGLGAVKVPVKSGAVAPSSAPLAETVFAPTVFIGGLNATIAYSGLAPGLVGLYQVNAVVPNGLQTGSQGIQIVISGVASNLATVAVTR